MGKFVRYGLAAVCFAASVGCLALWGLTEADRGRLYEIGHVVRSAHPVCQAAHGCGFLGIIDRGMPLPSGWYVASEFVGAESLAPIQVLINQNGQFGAIDERHIYFPLWYAALIFALAGVGVLRFRRWFSIRGALTAVSVIAALLGMVVAL